MNESASNTDNSIALGELARLFLKLGTIGFGGPAAHIAMLEDEVVKRRRWLTEADFMDLLGATNLIPGPNSTEMTMQIGYRVARWSGLFVAGVCFILPAVLITLALAVCYGRYGRTPGFAAWLAGVQPAVLAIIFVAGWRLGRKAVKGAVTGGVAALACLGVLATGAPFQAFLIATTIGILILVVQKKLHLGGSQPDNGAPSVFFALESLTRVGWESAAHPTIPALALCFLKVGCVLYGSGYVLFSYLREELVLRAGWLTESALLEAIAVGQLTPGPILSTATFIGYVIMYDANSMWRGVAGACAATVGLFLPSFLLVGIVGPLVPRLRRHPVAAMFLDSVNAASIGLLAAVTFKIAWGQINDWRAMAIAVVASMALIRFRISAVGIVALGAIAGRLLQLAP